MTTHPTTKDQSLQKTLFWTNYLSQDTETFGNAYQSAIKAGYSNDSAKNITRRDWFKVGNVRTNEMLDIAEQNMLDILNTDCNEEIIIDNKHTGLYRINPQLLRIKAEMSVFIASTLGKKRYNKKIDGVNIETVIVQNNPHLKSLFRL